MSGATELGMELSEMSDYVAHFRMRVLQDALTEALAMYWLRRAATFDDAMPRPGDYTGSSSPAEVEEQRHRLAATALACRQRATVSLDTP